MAALELSRRQLLTALLGAPFAACSRRGNYEVSIAGANDQLGHLFRDGFSKAPDSESRIPIVIVGGGIAGLSAGWRLLRAGFGEFRILELDDAPGGTARMGENEISRHPWGAHYLPMPLKSGSSPADAGAKASGPPPAPARKTKTSSTASTAR
jgi:hypothetical protein